MPFATVICQGDGVNEFHCAAASVTLPPKPCFYSGKAAIPSGAALEQGFHLRSHLIQNMNLLCILLIGSQETALYECHDGDGI